MNSSRDQKIDKHIKTRKNRWSVKSADWMMKTLYIFGQMLGQKNLDIKIYIKIWKVRTSDQKMNH